MDDLEDMYDDFRSITKFENDTYQYFMISKTAIVEFFKIIMASFLSLTVVQSCDGEMCNFSDLIDNDSLLLSAISMNLLNMIVFFLFYIVEFKREIYQIRYLDIDKTKGDYKLVSIRKNEKKYAYIFKDLDWYNSLYRIVLYVLLCITIINWSLSSVLVANRYYSFKTIITLLTNILLMSSKLSESYTISSESLEHKIGISAYLKEFTSFNVIDKDYIK